MSNKKYDFLVIGAGFFGCTFAEQVAKAGYKVLVIDQNDFIGGVSASEQIKGIEVHKFGPHIFRTNDEIIWKYINYFSELIPLVNTPIANYKGELYNLPFNMNTFNRIWPDVITPQDAINKIEEEKAKVQVQDPESNLENKIISMVGTTIYEKLVKGYTEKQWERPCSELPASIISVLPLRFTFNNNYFSAKYQGIPLVGYSYLMQIMLDSPNIDVRLNTKFTGMNDPIIKLADNVIYTGRIDTLFDYKLGHLEFRGAHFETDLIEDCDNYQGVAVMNYTDKETPYLRITEHKRFTGICDGYNYTIISKEYSEDATENIEHSYYPIMNVRNKDLYKKYKELLPLNFYVGGVMGEYEPYTMEQTIKSATNLASRFTKCSIYEQHYERSCKY